MYVHMYVLGVIMHNSFLKRESLSHSFCQFIGSTIIIGVFSKWRKFDWGCFLCW